MEQLTGKRSDPPFANAIREHELQRMNTSASDDGQESDDETIDHEQVDDEVEDVEEEEDEEDGSEALIPDISNVVVELRSSNSTSDSTSTSRSRLDDLYGPQFDFIIFHKQEEVLQELSQEKKDGTESLTDKSEVSPASSEIVSVTAINELVLEITRRLCEKLVPDMGKLALSNLVATFLAVSYTS